MSEVKGTLLGIVPAISVFSIVFGIITLAVNRSSNSIASRMDDAAEIEPTVTPNTGAVVYNYGN